MTRILLDTNIIIDWFSGGPSQKILNEYINKEKVSLFISFISVIEFLSKADNNAEKILTKVIQSNELTVIYIDSIEILKGIASIRVKTGLKIPDAIILSSARENDLLLMTRDKELYNKGSKCCRIKYIKG